MSRLHEIIDERGLKLLKVCKDTGLTRQTLRNIKKGKAVTAETARKIEEFTNGEVKLQIRSRGKSKKPRSKKKEL